MKFLKVGIVFSLIIISFVRSFGSPAITGSKNVLLINSYHQGFAWTDSLTLGITNTFKLYPQITLRIENLDSKQFGKSIFEIHRSYLKNKYSGILFDGVLVTDNDALDFAMQYDQNLFPGVPVVFSGISNPEDYQLEGSKYYGIKESGTSDNAVKFIKSILPECKRLLVISDLTTTGIIYRKEFTQQASAYKNFEVIFPEVIDLNSIFQMVRSNKDYDAIYCVGINLDNEGKLIDAISLTKEICRLSNAPVFSNDPILIGNGIVGGLFSNGIKQGYESAQLLIKLLDTENYDAIKHINSSVPGYFFDSQLLEKYHISSKSLPAGALIFNQQTIFTKEHFGILSGLILLLSLIIVILSVINRRRKKAQKWSKSQLLKIETQKSELEETSRKLSIVISELEESNNKLNETNVNLLEAKKKAEESDNLKSAFLANVSHEIRTPLNSIVGFSSLLGETDLSEETRNSYIELIESNTESLLVLIDEILDLSKIEAQQLTLKMQDFSIDDLISELFQIFSHGTRKKHVELRVAQTIDNKSLSVFSDRVRVKQIFINLLSNAFKFTDLGYIEIGYFVSGNQEVVLFVKDTGIGIRNEHHQAIFHRFRKLNENSSRIYRGTGLGLAITQKLVELLGGRIWIESEPGQGTTFYFTLKDCELKEKLG